MFYNEGITFIFNGQDLFIEKFFLVSRQQVGDSLGFELE
jgi:hypothetical protein